MDASLATVAAPGRQTPTKRLPVSKAAPGNGRTTRSRLGRSRGGLTTKIHLACDGTGRVLAFVLSGGQVNDCTRFTHVMNAIRVARPGPGRPRVRPDHVIADKGYSSRAIREHLRARGIGHTVPERGDQAASRYRRGSVGGRPSGFDPAVYRHRNVVERCFNHLKRNRSIATRYDKTAISYQATITIAALLQWALTL